MNYFENAGDVQRTDFLKRSITVTFLKTKRGPVGGGETDMGTGGYFFVMMEMFHILILVVVTLLYILN